MGVTKEEAKILVKIGEEIQKIIKKNSNYFLNNRNDFHANN